MATQLYEGDTRFYEGYVWLFDDNLMLGYCSKGDTPEEAVENWVEFYRRKYWLKGREIRIHSLTDPDAYPIEHRIMI